MSARNYCFTLYFNAEEEAAIVAGHNFGTKLDYYFADPCFRYVVGQLEKGVESGRIHFQGYCELTKTMRIAAVKKAVPDNALFGVHMEKRASTDRQPAIDYCKKEETRIAGPWTYGEDAVNGRPKINLDDAIAFIIANPYCTSSEVATAFPALWVRHHGGLLSLMSTLEKPLIGDADFVPSSWQKVIIDMIRAEADDRTIHWITDRDGACGKSRLAKHLKLEYGAINLSGRVQDMCLAYSQNMAPVVVFDISRGAVEMSDHLYTMAENLKNGVIMNTKYQSREISFKPPHVIFFSNSTYQAGKWSVDRVKETVLTAADKWVAPPVDIDQMGFEADFDPEILQELFDDLLENPLPPDNIW